MTPGADDRLAMLMQEIASLRMRVATLEKLVVGSGPPFVLCGEPEKTAAGFAPPTMMRVRAPRVR